MSFLSNKKLRKYWYDGVHRILVELGVTTVYQPGSTFIKEYRIQTSVGLLTIHPPSPDSEFMSVCSRFDDVESANRVFGDRGWHHNPHTGKYNLHISIPGKVKPEEKLEYIKQALDQVRRHFESVMEVQIMNEQLIEAFRKETPVWSNKLNDWCYVVEIWPNGSYFLAPWPRATGTSHNLSDIDLSKEFSLTGEV